MSFFGIHSTYVLNAFNANFTIVFVHEGPIVLMRLTETRRLLYFNTRPEVEDFFVRL